MAFFILIMDHSFVQKSSQNYEDLKDVLIRCENLATILRNAVSKGQRVDEDENVVSALLKLRK